MTQKRRLAWALALLFVVNIAVISLAQQAEAATYRLFIKVYKSLN